MTNDNDIVYFETSSGEKVSNDPRFTMAEMRKRMMESAPNFGHEGPHPGDERVAQVPDQSVLENRLTGRDLQHGDRQSAEDRGLSDPDEQIKRTTKGVDINDAIKEERKRRAKEAEDASTEQEERIEQMAEGEQDEYSSMDTKQLKAEAEKRDLDLKGVKTKGQLRKKLREHDAQTE